MKADKPTRGEPPFPLKDYLLKDKGKRALDQGITLHELRAALREAVDERQAVEESMRGLVQEFLATVRSPWAMRPGMQRVAQGRCYIRWRRGQESLTVGRAQEIMQEMGHNSRLWHAQRWQATLELNLRHALALGQEMRLRQGIREWMAWEAAQKNVDGS